MVGLLVSSLTVRDLGQYPQLSQTNRLSVGLVSYPHETWTTDKTSAISFESEPLNLMTTNVSNHHTKLSLIVCYTPANDADDTLKVELYDNISSVIDSIPLPDVKGRGCVDQVFTLRLIIEKCLRCQTPLVFIFLDYEQSFDSVNRRALAKVLCLYGIPDKYIKVIYALYENNTAEIKVENQVSSWFCIKSRVKQGCVQSQFIWIVFIDFLLRRTGKAVGDHGIKWGGKTLLDIRLC